MSPASTGHGAATGATAAAADDATALSLRDAGLAFGTKVLWTGLDLDVDRGEFVAVLGANGAGKTCLLRSVLGLQPLTAGEVRVAGRTVRRGRRDIGYVPQQRRIDELTPMRVRDVVRQGLDGHRWGIARPGRVDWRRVDAALARVDASDLADTPIGVLSGGSSNVSGSRRRSSGTRRCCCATNRCCPSTWRASGPSPR